MCQLGLQNLKDPSFFVPEIESLSHKLYEAFISDGVPVEAAESYPVGTTNMPLRITFLKVCQQLSLWFLHTSEYCVISSLQSCVALFTTATSLTTCTKQFCKIFVTVWCICFHPFSTFYSSYLSASGFCTFSCRIFTTFSPCKRCKSRLILALFVIILNNNIYYAFLL
nr:unnamed protein product [Callosobruchus analis]